jgi:hypothetical protein
MPGEGVRVPTDAVDRSRCGRPSVECEISIAEARQAPSSSLAPLAFTKQKNLVGPDSSN